MNACISPAHSLFTPGIEIKNLEILANGKPLLTIHKLALPTTGVFSIIGASGSGKSSLLKALSGLLDDNMALRGDVTQQLHGVRGPMQTNRVAMVWQQPVVFPCSVWNNLKLPLQKRKVRRHQWAAQMQIALQRTGLFNELGERWQDVSAETLSGGQRQRLCLAIGLLKDADVILLDEPTSALDPQATARIENVIADLAKTKLVILVTHSIGQARRLSQHTAVCCRGEHGGIICETGATASLFAVPQSEQSRRFIQYETGACFTEHEPECDSAVA